MDTISRYIIYGLIDPRDGKLRYVGKSANGLARPKRRHHARCWSWEESLLKYGLKPEIEVIEQFESRDELNDAEIFWISYFKMIGCNLTNISKGGDGNVCLTGSAHPFFGKHHSNETKEKIALKLRGQKLQDDVKKKIGIGVSGPKNGRFGKKNSEHANKINRLKHSKPVICLNDGKIFSSGKEAAKFYHIDPGSVCHNINGRSKETRSGLRFAFAPPGAF